MFAGFYRSSLNIWQLTLTRITPIQYPVASKYCYFQKSYYSTESPNENVSNSTSLESYRCSVEAHCKAGDMDRATEVLHLMSKTIKSQSMEWNESIFERLIELAAKKGSTEVLNVVRLMCTDLNIQPQIPFVRDHILPALNAKENLDDAMAKLQTTKIGKRVIMLAIITNRLHDGDIQTAYEYAKTNKTFYGIETIRKPLLSAFKTTDDIKIFVSFVRLIHDSFLFIKNYYQGKKLTKSEIGVKQKAFVGEILALAISNHCDNTRLILQLLKAFADEGFTITTEQAINIQKSLHVNDETDIGRLLKKLSMESIEIQHGTPNIANKLSSVQNVFDNKQTHGRRQMNATEKRQFYEYIQNENLSEIESLLANDKIFFSESDYTHLIELYIQVSDLEKAMNILKKVCENNAGFKLNCNAVVKLVTLMVEMDRDFNEIELVLQNHRPEKPELIYIAVELLEQLASCGYVNLVEKLFDALLKYNYTDASVTLAGPLVLANIQNGTLAEAVNKYDYIAKRFKFVTLTSVLFIELIKKEEIELLKRAYNIFKGIRGIEVAQAQLAFAFVRCGRERHARAVFEDEDTKNLARHLLHECAQYVKYGRLEEAKTLLSATKGLQCDRHIIYQTILDIYEKKNEAVEALKLWHEYSTEDGILPKQQFQTKLIDLLKSNNMAIPKELQDKQENSTRRKIKTIKSQTLHN